MSPQICPQFIPPRDDVPDLEECRRLGINPNDPGAPTYGDRRKRETMTQTAEALPTPATKPGLLDIPVPLLLESKSNPRKTWGDIAGLAESVRQVGVLEPLAATKDEGADTYTLVYGHRRLRAAKKAGLATVPVIIRAPMTAKEVLEAQVVENSARADVHPLEEAEGYERLHTQHGLAVEDIAAKVNKSKAAVYARMKLCALCPEARKAFYDELLTPSTALFVARIPHHDVQRQALKDLTRERYDGEMPSAREAFRIISGKYMLRLAEAPFPTADATLVPKAGSCSSCPKRTGNQPELFSDVKSADVCTDPTCWEQKRIAACATRTAELEAKGVKVVVGAARARAFGAPELEPPTGYAKASEHSYEHHGVLGEVYKRACKEKGTEPKRVVMFDEKGKAVELVSKASLPKSKRAASGSRYNYDEQYKRNEKLQKARERAESRVKALFAVALKKAPPSGDAAWRFVSYAFDVYRPEAKKERAALQRLSGPALVAGVFKLISENHYHFHKGGPEELGPMLHAHYKIDAKAIEAEELAKVAPKAKAKTDKTPPPPSRDAKAVARAAKSLKKKGGKK